MTEEDKNKVSSENENSPSEPDTSDFPTDEYVIESFNLDIPSETPDTIPPQTESRQDLDKTENGE